MVSLPQVGKLPRTKSFVVASNWTEDRVSSTKVEKHGSAPGKPERVRLTPISNTVLVSSAVVVVLAHLLFPTATHSFFQGGVTTLTELTTPQASSRAAAGRSEQSMPEAISFSRSLPPGLQPVSVAGPHF